MKDHYYLHKDLLKGEYFQTFDRVELYTDASGIDPETCEERLTDLFDLFLAAQEDDRPVEKLIGDDIEAFCRSYFSEYTVRDRLKKQPRRWLPVVWFVFVMELINLIGEGSLFGAETNMGDYLIGLFIGVVLIGLVNACIRPFIFRIRWLTAGKFEAFLLILLVAFLALSFALDIDPIVLVPSWAVLLFTGAYLIVYYGVTIRRNKKRYGTLRRPKDESRTSFWKEVNESVARDLPGELVKKYEKKNRKREKKGQPPITPGEYMDMLRKETAMSEKMNLAGVGIVLLFCLVISVREMIANGMVEGLILFAVLMVAEIPMWLLFRSSIKNNPRKELLQKCDELGVTVIEYAARESHADDWQKPEV